MIYIAKFEIIIKHDLTCSTYGLKKVTKTFKKYYRQYFIISCQKV